MAVQRAKLVGEIGPPFFLRSRCNGSAKLVLPNRLRRPTARTDFFALEISKRSGHAREQSPGSQAVYPSQSLAERDGPAVEIRVGRDGVAQVGSAPLKALPIDGPRGGPTVRDPVRDESLFRGSLLEFHVTPSIRICRVLPQKQATIFLVEEVIRRAARRHGRQIELQRLVLHMSELPSTTGIVGPVIGGLGNGHVHDGSNRTRPVRPENERVLVHGKMIPDAHVAQALDRELSGLPASDEFLGFHRSRQVSVL